MNKTNSSAHLNFQAKFLMIAFLIGLFVVLLISVISLNGLKQDYDNSFPKPADETYVLTQLRAIFFRYAANSDPTKTLDINAINHVWNRYKSNISDEYSFYAFNKSLYQRIFLNKHYSQLTELEAEKKEATDKIDYLIKDLEARQSSDIDSLGVYALGDILQIKGAQIITLALKTSEIAQKISGIEYATTNEFYKSVLHALLAFALSVFIMVFMSTRLTLESIKNLNKLLNLDLNEANEQLKELNTHLEQKAMDLATDLRVKDAILYQQSRLASMGEAIQNIAHQWRQPLGALVLLLQTLEIKSKKGTLTPELLAEKVQYGKDIARSMSETIDTFRGFLKPDSTVTSFALDEALKDSITLMKPTFEDLNIAVECNLEERLLFVGQKSALAQIIMVFLQNAKDALIANEIVDKTCYIDLKKDGGYAIITCEDNAGGIKDDVIDRVFEPYFTTKHKSSGTGVGLYIVDQLTREVLRGEVSVRNGKKGAVFTLKLSLQETQLTKV
ncbi:HAMP domain-containing sensor histidine kinase [Helicobacter sp. 11S02629-2]|uniref:sensor histidine kinase n=1 Tax=Helicobacter sp. 11S02629-2 TaxID=1476195 RepID=UPI000BA76144|nr:HAMP domain-containing sensor histidine kinase [Helicobacter sp. 11S02629-2]PAF45734.1 hypothetical protein BKH40_02340 [Helicobacter sp. 11S02629-2]